MMSVSAPERRTKQQGIACELGVTGKRVRRALPTVAPAPLFRARLRAQLGLLASPAPPLRQLGVDRGAIVPASPTMAGAGAVVVADATST
jgi:hypothetical protein